jgi:di/tricarboxylate transporter
MLAWCSLGALVIVMIVSCTTQLNVGVLAIAFAWVVGVFIAGLTPKEVLAAFPYDLFIILAGVTLLFTQAQLNGTLDRVAHHAVRLCRATRG